MSQLQSQKNSLQIFWAQTNQPKLAPPPTKNPGYVPGWEEVSVGAQKEGLKWGWLLNDLYSLPHRRRENALVKSLLWQWLV